jgi:hypothetical protein
MGWLAGAAGAGPAEAGRVRVVVDSPGSGEVVRGPIHQARIAGSAHAGGAQPERFDVMIALDVSASTRAASGVDVDGDGVVGVNPRFELLPPGSHPPDVLSTDPEDSILHAQVAAARALVDSLDSGRIRVGVLTFSGEVDPDTGTRRREDQEDARLEVPLTEDYEQVRRAFEQILERGASGATNFAAGIHLGIRELAGLSGASSSARAGATRVLLFLSDGVPTLPVGRGDVSDPGDREAAIRAARVARRAGIVIHTYGLGPEAVLHPDVLTEMARATLGTYTPVRTPGEIIALLPTVDLADVADVVLANLTTGELSTDVRLAPDGRFDGFVPVREGVNRIRVSALSVDGEQGSAELELRFEHVPFGEPQSLAELERIRRQNRELELRRLEMEIEAFRAEQRKELDVRAEPRSQPPAPRRSEPAAPEP